MTTYANRAIDDGWLQRASCAVTAVGLRQTKDDNAYVSSTPSPSSVDIKGRRLLS